MLPEQIGLDLYEMDHLRDITRGGMHRDNKQLKMKTCMERLKQKQCEALAWGTCSDNDTTEENILVMRVAHTPGMRVLFTDNQGLRHWLSEGGHGRAVLWGNQNWNRLAMCEGGCGSVECAHALPPRTTNPVRPSPRRHMRTSKTRISSRWSTAQSPVCSVHVSRRATVTDLVAILESYAHFKKEAMLIVKDGFAIPPYAMVAACGCAADSALFLQYNICMFLQRRWVHEDLQCFRCTAV